MKQRTGASLLEVLIASLILAVGILPIITSLQAGRRDAAQLEHATQALARARGLLESTRVLGPSTFDRLLAGQEEAPVPLELARDVTGEGTPALLTKMAALEEKVTVRLVRRQGEAGLYVLTARVGWAAPVSGAARSLTLVTLVASPDASLKLPLEKRNP